MIWSLAWRNVSAHKSRTALNALGIVLGVGLMFAVLALSVTLVSSFDNLYGSIYGKTDLIVSAPNDGGTIRRSAFAKVKADRGVETATANVLAVVSIVRHGKAGGNQADQLNTAGVASDAPDLTGAKLIDGRRVRRGREITLDSDFAKRHKLKPGRRIKLATPAGTRKFRVVGIMRFGSSLQFGGQGFASVPIAVARDVFDVKSRYSEISVKVAKSADVSTVKRSLRESLGSKVVVKTPSEKSSDAAGQLRAFNVILYFFAAMSLFVGGYLILNSFNMTVAQRLHEIGMLRTICASRGQIVQMILVEALLLGALGAALGVFAGFGLTHLMAALVKAVSFPIGAVTFPTIAFILAPVAGIAATLLGALRPAIQAGRVPAIQAVLAEHRATPLRLSRRLAFGAVMIPLGLMGVFILASSSTIPPMTAAIGVSGIVILLAGVILVAPVVIPALVHALSWPIRLITPIEGRMAADSTRANPIRTSSTASGLMIGIALVAAIGCLGSSLIGSISDQLDKHLLNDFTIQPRDFRQGGMASKTTISRRAIKRVAALSDAKLATGTKMLYVSKGFRGSDYQALGFDPKVRDKVVTLKYNGQSASEVLARVARGQVTIGGQLKRGRHLRAGDTIRLRGAGGVKRLKIAGVLSGASFEDQSIGMSNRTFSKVFEVDRFTQIDVVASSATARPRLEKRIKRLLRRDYSNLDVLSNSAIKRQVETQTNQIFSIFYVIMLIAIVVSLLGVVNTLLISVLERTREIGVLRAIGSDRWQVRRIITDESVLLTFAGALLGLCVGMAIGYAFVRGVGADLDGIGFRPPTTIILAVACASILLGLIAAIVPAYRAAKLNIIAAVSYE